MRVFHFFFFFAVANSSSSSSVDLNMFGSVNMYRAFILNRPSVI